LSAEGRGNAERERVTPSAEPRPQNAEAVLEANADADRML